MFQTICKVIKGKVLQNDKIIFIISRTFKSQRFSTKISTSVFDFSNIQQGITASSNGFLRIHNSLDEYSRELLLYLANELLGNGMGNLSNIYGYQISFTPLMFSAQLNACRMKLIEPETKNFQNMIQRAMRAQDFKASRAAQKQFKLFKRKHNINMLIQGLSILQMPFLFTWFLSLRYLSSLPDKYEGLKSQGFLWFQDLSLYDLYGILPIMSSFFKFGTSLQILKCNHNLMYLSQNIFFPVGVNLYQCSSAFCHLIIRALARKEKIRKIFGIPKQLTWYYFRKIKQYEYINYCQRCCIRQS